MDPESPENIRAQLGHSFNLIRFFSMNSRQFVQCLSINLQMFTNDEIQQFSSEIAIPTREPKKSNCKSKTENFDITTPFMTPRSSLPNLLEVHSTTDVIFVCTNEQNQETGRFAAHKCVLVRQCKALSDEFQHKTIKEVNVPGVPTNHFDTFLQLTYTYSYDQRKSIMKEITKEDTGAILSLLSKYKATGIITSFAVYLIETLNMLNVTRYFQWARTFSMDILKFECIHFLKKRRELVFWPKAFSDIDQRTLKALLDLKIWNKTATVVHACIRWAKRYCQINKLDEKNPKKLRAVLDDAFDLMPFSAMNPAQFVRFVKEYRNMLSGDEIVNVIENYPDVPTEALNAYLRLTRTNDWELHEKTMKNVSDENLNEILLFAKEYHDYGVKGVIDGYLTWNLNEENVMWCFELSHKHSMGGLKSECVNFLKENSAQLITSEIFVGCSQQNLQAILEHRIWNHEKLLVDSCMKWAKKYCEEHQIDAANPENLRMVMGDAFPLIPFSSLDAIELIHFQREFRGLLTFEEIGKIINEIANCDNVKPA